MKTQRTDKSMALSDALKYAWKEWSLVLGGDNGNGGNLIELGV